MSEPSWSDSIMGRERAAKSESAEVVERAINVVSTPIEERAIWIESTIVLERAANTVSTQVGERAMLMEGTE